ncbi:MAG: hypothetical protein HGA51_10690, partial [Demequinaceae bacterium]|nr:hypothetical protein [Demequinaceae bacterium]
ALGAFFAGMVLRESDLAHRAAEDSLPLRDAFAVLFFLAVGMLVDPRVAIERPLALAATVAVIVLGKLVIAYVIVRALKYSRAMALAVAASLAQIGEFSFILVTLGAEYKLMPADAQSLVLAGAIVSIAINPLLFAWATRSYRAREDELDASVAPVASAAEGHVIVVGFGRVGARVAAGLWQRGDDVVVIDDDETRVESIRALGHEAVLGNAARTKVLRAAGAASARAVLIAIPDPLNAGAVAASAKAVAPAAIVTARGHRDSDVAYLKGQGADRVIVGVHEVADLMVSSSAPQAI